MFEPRRANGLVLGILAYVMSSDSNILKKGSNISIALLFLLLPLYFKTPFFVPVAFIGFLAILALLLKIQTYENKTLWFVPFYLILGIIQLIINPDLKIYEYITRLSAIIIFIVTLSVVTTYYDKKYDKYLLFSFIFVILYALYSAPSYILGYENFLIPGTCLENNLSVFNHLRCSTFGEGNYFGGYLSLMILIFSQRPSFMLLSLFCVLVSFSPTSMLIWLYLFIRKYIFKGDYGWVLISSIASFLIFISILTLDISIIRFFFGDSETSSFWERFEFIRSSFKMWSDNMIIGIGLGQFGYYLSDYTVFNHLITSANDGARYIPNSNLAEILSEQGLYGLVFYFYILYKLYYLNHPLLNHYELIIVFIIIGLAMPTLFQIVIAALLGVLISKFSKMPI